MWVKVGDWDRALVEETFVPVSGLIRCYKLVVVAEQEKVEKLVAGRLLSAFLLVHCLLETQALSFCANSTELVLDFRSQWINGAKISFTIVENSS